MKKKKLTYFIVRNVISKELAAFVNEYFLLKRKVARKFFDTRYISPFTNEWGVWNDDQVPETYAHYADIAMEVLLDRLRPLMEKKTGLKLYPTYSYERIYKKGDILARHKDRYSCEFSTTMNLGGDEWPIYLEEDPKHGFKKKKEPYVHGNTSGKKIILKPGDMLIYSGCEMEHWREPFKGEYHTQVFLHYNDVKKDTALANKYDKRPHLGLPFYFRQ